MPDTIARGLYLVATPIGNLGDITLRAIEVLKSVDRIACEDTRQTQKLLNHYGITTPTISYHQHNERERAIELVAALKEGGRLALVSDAGMPGISDPGLLLVREAIAAGVNVIPMPGANAALSALSRPVCKRMSFASSDFYLKSRGRAVLGSRIWRRRPARVRRRSYFTRLPTGLRIRWPIWKRYSGRVCTSWSHEN
jgi:16S rRNA (cytidine1402-2'-O)-methyltransferase